MKIQIKNRFNNSVIFEHDCEDNSIKITVVAALAACANLRDANLCGADLRGANLRDANLCGADLRGANLRDAYLRDAYLCGANLRGANLRDANLCGADLCGANLRGANLCGANLCGADLCGANLRGANLCGANLCEIKNDFLERLKLVPNEAGGLLLAIKEGRINGTSYGGDCACFVGTVANIQGVDYGKLENLKPDSSTPTERWFLGISKGDTPENSQISAITADWVQEFVDSQVTA